VRAVPEFGRHPGPAPEAARRAAAAPARSRYRAVNLGLAIASLLLVAAPAALSLAPGEDGLLLGDARLPDLCMWRRAGLTGPTCGLGRSVVLAAQGSFDASAARHPGGLVLLAALAVHGVVRGGLAAAGPSGRRWWLDVAVSAAGLFLLFASIALLRA
jgi:hypothetical protein